MTDAHRYYQAVETFALESLTSQQSVEAKPLVQQIVDDWLRQADEEASLERDDLVDIGLSGLRKSLAGKVGEARLAALHALALKPGVQHTSTQAFDLAQQVADGKVTRREAAPAAARLQEHIHRLMQDVKQLQDADNQRLLMRELADADLEVRYVLEEEEGAISIRLNRYIHR